jgi:hypothetical protein
MTVNATLLNTVAETNNISTITSGSVTPAPFSTLLIAARCNANRGPISMSHSLFGATSVDLSSGGLYSGNATSGTLFVGVIHCGVAPGSSAITVSFGSAATHRHIHVIQLTGRNLTTPVRQSRIRAMSAPGFGFYTANHASLPLTPSMGLHIVTSTKGTDASLSVSEGIGAVVSHTSTLAADLHRFLNVAAIHPAPVQLAFVTGLDPSTVFAQSDVEIAEEPFSVYIPETVII